MEAGQRRTDAEKRLYEASLNGDVKSLNQLMKEDPLILSRSCITCFNETPLHVAAMLGHLDFVKSLLRYKPDLAAEQNSQGFSPLHLAAANGYVEIVKVLVVENPDACLIRDEDGKTPLHLAVMKGRVDVVEQLVRTRPEVVRYTVDRGETVLHLAAKHNRLGALKVLVEFERGDEFVNVTDDDGNTVLHTATSLKQIETVKYLLGNTRVKVNAVNKNGFTALDIIDNMPRDLKVMEIRECLLNAEALRARKLPSNSGISTNSEPEVQELDTSTNGKVALTDSPTISKNKREQHWVEKSRGLLIVSASIIAAITYQAGISPPGGFWDRHSTANDSPGDFKAGTAIWAVTNINQYCDFYVRNTIAFVASLSLMFLLVSGFHLRRKIFNYFLMAIMWATIISMAFSYLGLVIDVGAAETSPETHGTFLWIAIVMIAWLVILGIILAVQAIRFLVWVVRKGSTKKNVPRRKNQKGESLV